MRCLGEAQSRREAYGVGTACSAQRSVMTQRDGRQGVGGRFKSRRVFAYLQLIPVAQLIGNPPAVRETPV